jgi:hypothetical protein
VRRRLVERLHTASDWDTRFDILERFLLARAGTGPRPTPAVAWALGRLWQTAGRERVDSLAADQSHLNRDFRELAGTTPGDFVARLLPGYGGVMGDGVPFVQD